MIFGKIKDIFKKTKVSFIMCIITFIIGCFLTNMTSSISVFKLALIFFAPFLVFLLFVLLYYKFFNNLKIINILDVITVMLIVFLLFYYVLAIFGCALEEVENPITDISKYSKIIKGSSREKVFPKEIPDNVNNVKFIYAPGILQGSTETVLYYVDNNMDVSKFDDKYKDNAIWIGNIDEYAEKEGLLTGAFSNTPAYDNNSSDYVIYLYDDYCDDSGYCNHGEFLFSAFNEKTNEVIYKHEYW